MISVVSLFAGCGGSDVGLYAAAKDLGIDFEVVAAYDSWEPAVRVYNANLPHPVARVCDLKALDELPPCNLVIGGPPCQDHSMAGKRACRCDKGEEPTQRCCLREFVRLAGDKPYIMENVVSRLINAPWSERLCAADFGDVTSRKRWFYSNYLLHVIPTPGPRRIRDIRDHAEDERVLAKRASGAPRPSNIATGAGKGNVMDDEDVMPSMTTGNGGYSGYNRVTCKAGNHAHYESDESLGSLTAHAWHGHDIRSGKLIAIHGGEYGVVERFAPTSFHGPPYTLRLGLRGNSASAFEDDETLGSVLSNSWHGNGASRIVGCRNVSLLEMQRAHSFPESWDWAGATKAQRGQMIANSWPIGMATAVCKAMLSQLTPAKGER